jgi:hypothetical protein
MGKIINFCEARQKLELGGLVSALKWQQSREKPHTGPAKRPRIVSALPGETIPPEFPDFRPLLQRDGLILLGWSRWDLESRQHIGKGPCYTVDWITSAPNRHHRRYTVGLIFQDEMGAAKPDCSGNPYFF